MPNSVEWRANTESSRSRQVALYAVLGGFGGALLGILLGLFTVVVRSIQQGDFGLPALLLLLLFALVGGPLSLVYLWPMLTDPDLRPPLPAEYGSWRPDYRWLAIALVATTLLAGGITLSVRGGHLLVAACWFALCFALSLTGTTGHIAPSTDTISVGGQTAALSAITRVRRLDLPGAYSLFLLGYQAPVAAAPRLLVIPGDAADDAYELLLWGAAIDTPESGTRSLIGRLPFFVAAGCCLLVAVGLWFVGGRYAGSAFTLAPGIGLFALLGSLFAWFGFEG